MQPSLAIPYEVARSKLDDLALEAEKTFLKVKTSETKETRLNRHQGQDVFAPPFNSNVEAEATEVEQPVPAKILGI